MDLLLGLRGSKKTSEAGVWVSDEEVRVCMICKASFGLMKRKHHCRQCGAVVCGDCSGNRKFLESSRTGAPKRICDTCHDKDRGRGADDDDDDDSPAAAVAKLSLGGGHGGGHAGAGAGHSAGASSDAGAPVAVPLEVAVQALKDHPFEGKWTFTLRFAVVDIGSARSSAAASAVVPGVDLSAFNKAAAGQKSKDGGASHVIRAGSAVDIVLQLKPKGTSYFQGDCANFFQFGRDGKVTGALQRTSGKINMTIQMTNNKTTTSFNFVGLMNAAGRVAGTFSGCEISKNAGSVSGTYTAERAEEAEGEDGGGGGGGGAAALPSKAADEDDSD